MNTSPITHRRSALLAAVVGALALGAAASLPAHASTSVQPYEHNARVAEYLQLQLQQSSTHNSTVANMLGE